MESDVKDLWETREISAAEAVDAGIKSIKSEVNEVAFAGRLTGVAALRAHFVKSVVQAGFDIPDTEIDALIYRMGVESQIAKMGIVHQVISDRLHQEAASSNEG